MARVALGAALLGAGVAPAGARPAGTPDDVDAIGHLDHTTTSVMADRPSTLQTRSSWVLQAPSAPDTDAEEEFVESLNGARAAAGLPPLRVDPSLTAAARDWAVSMASRHVLEHASDITVGVPADWTKAGENVGRGGSVPSIFEAFMASPGHAANVLDPAYTRVGVGVVWSDDGVLYTTHRFAGAASDSEATPPPTPEPTPVPPTELPFADPDGDDIDPADPATDEQAGSEEQGEEQGEPTDGHSVDGDTGDVAAPRPEPARLELNLRLLLDAVG